MLEFRVKTILIPTLQGFGSIATKSFVARHAESWQLVSIATKRHSLAAVAIGRMVIGYRHEKENMAINLAIATSK